MRFTLAIHLAFIALALTACNQQQDSVGHLQNVDPGDWPRFGELGVSANFTPWWLGFDDPDPVGAGLGEARDNDTYRARAIADAGGNVTFSSDDWTLRVFSPFLGMQVGHTRQFPREWLTPFAAVRAEMGKIDVLVYNAGSGVWGNIEELSAHDFEQSWRINAMGAFLVSEEVIPSMKENKAGTIILVGATALGLVI